MDGQKRTKVTTECRENRPVPKSLALKIGVMGGAGQGIAPDYLQKAFALGEAIAQANCITITGACPGLPQEAPGTAAARRTVGEHRYVFCSLNCADRFDLDSKGFIEKEQSIEQ